MSYSIKVRVYQTNPNAYFKCVEKGVWHYANGGTWTEQDGVLTLTMGGSGTSGMVRFMTEQGKEAFFIAMGVHNYKPWLDIITGLADDITCVKALPEYYNNTNPERCRSREAQRTSESILNIDRRTIAASYKVAEGHNLELNIVLG
ncbi:lectin [Mariannaea sp. PMI_226]|nr:lectin [Mariannaea sp. PMI_226]